MCIRDRFTLSACTATGDGILDATKNATIEGINVTKDAAVGSVNVASDVVSGTANAVAGTTDGALDGCSNADCTGSGCNCGKTAKSW